MSNGVNILKQIWVASDHHFYHKNIIRFCDRPFATVEEMNAEMIKRHNEVVGHNDDVYFLGDIAFCDEARLIDILLQMNGTKYLVLGNHDNVIRKSKNPKLLTQFEWIKDYFELKIPNQTAIGPIVLCHYPLHSWNRMHHGALHFYGHTHGSVPTLMSGRGRDIGMDTNDCRPWNVRELVSEMLKCPIVDARGR